MNRDQIRAILMAKGFKETLQGEDAQGEPVMGLSPYVYDAVEAVLDDYQPAPHFPVAHGQMISEYDPNVFVVFDGTDDGFSIVGAYRYLADAEAASARNARQADNEMAVGDIFYPSHIRLTDKGPEWVVLPVGRWPAQVRGASEDVGFWPGEGRRLYSICVERGAAPGKVKEWLLQQLDTPEEMTKADAAALITKAWWDGFNNGKGQATAGHSAGYERQDCDSYVVKATLGWGRKVAKE